MLRGLWNRRSPHLSVFWRPAAEVCAPQVSGCSEIFFFGLPSGNQTWLAGKSHEIPPKMEVLTCNGKIPYEVELYNWEIHRTINGLL